MACRYAERMAAVFRDGKCHEGGAVSCDDIFPASFNLPRVFFPYFRKTCIRKRRPDAVYSMKTDGALAMKWSRSRFISS